MSAVWTGVGGGGVPGGVKGPDPPGETQQSSLDAFFVSKVLFCHWLLLRSVCFDAVCHWTIGWLGCSRGFWPTDQGPVGALYLEELAE